MSQSLLVRHPGPSAGESLTGYILRLSEVNGYASPWNLFRFADMKQNQARSSGMRVKKLAQVANRSVVILEVMAHSAPIGKPRRSRLLGQPILPTDLNLRRPRICPQCVCEKGIIEAHWDLELMVACPLHRCLALSACPKCGDRLSWFRPGLLECKCGADLRKGEPGSISDYEASLLDVIRRKALALPATKENPAGLPQEQLMAMNLRSLLSVVRTLGKHRMIADGASEDSGVERAVSAASQVLIDWPNNFIALFTDLGRALPATQASGVGRQFASIYTSLFKSAAIRPREQTDFMKLAFLDFAMNHWGRGVVDHKLVKELGVAIPKRYLTQTEFAAQIGVEQSTAARILKDPRVASRRVKSGMTERILVDLCKSSIPRTAPGKIFRKREAAKRLDLSVSVMEALKKDGLYKVNHLLPTRAGFHELDIEAFRQKLMELAPGQSSSTGVGGECVTLRDVMQGHHDSTATKIDVLRAVFSNEIAVVANTDGTPGGLVLDGPVYRGFVQDVRIRVAGNSVTLADVATILGCDSRTVPGLIKLGLIQGTATPSGLRATAESVKRLQEKYVSLACIADTEGTSSRALMQRCREKRVGMLLVPTTRRGGPQPFIAAADRGRLNLGIVQDNGLPAPTQNRRTAKAGDHSAKPLAAELVTELLIASSHQRLPNQQCDSIGEGACQ